MKTMIKMIAVLVTVIALSLAPCARGGDEIPVPTAEFPMGSPEIVTNYCVGKVTFLEVIFYKLVGTAHTWIDERSINRTFTSKQELDALARVYAQEMADNYVATNGSLEGQFQMSVFGESAVRPFATMLFTFHKFTFPQPREGDESQITIPTFGNMNIGLPSKVPYHAPGVVRAILQVRGEEFMGVIDSKGSSEITANYGVVRINSKHLIRQDWTNSLALIYSGAYHVYDRSGYRRPEKSPEVALVKNNQNFTLSVGNCEAGRIYKVEQTTNMVNWTTNSALVFEGPYEYTGAKTNFNFTATPTPGTFYRAVASDSWLP